MRPAHEYVDYSNSSDLLLKVIPSRLNELDESNGQYTRSQDTQYQEMARPPNMETKWRWQGMETIPCSPILAIPKQHFAVEL